jgi:hypothetical protein
VRRAREKLVALARRCPPSAVLPTARGSAKSSRSTISYAHARQFNRAKKALRKLTPVSAAASVTSHAGSQATRCSNASSRGAQPRPQSARAGARQAQPEGLQLARSRKASAW